MYEYQSDTELIELTVECQYYGTQRKTPVYIQKSQLKSMRYDEITSLINSEIPYLQRIIVPLRYCIKDETNNEIDLSPKYSTHQIARLLGRDLKKLSVRVIESESPLSLSQNVPSAPFKHNSRITAFTDHVSEPANAISKHSSKIGACASSKTHHQRPPKPTHIILPMERYAQKHAQEVDRLDKEIEANRCELITFGDKLNQASRENSGPLTACGNCHLKLGHTRRNCTFSPCQSAFSCGILSKHSGEKFERARIEKTIKNLNSKLNKAQNDAQHSKMVAQKVCNSNSKRIEDIVVKELPQRYVSCGFRNWALLNADVVRLAERLKSTLPTRENILPLLTEITTAQSSKELYLTTNRLRAGCGSRVLPQKKAARRGICHPLSRSEKATGRAISYRIV